MCYPSSAFLGANFDSCVASGQQNAYMSPLSNPSPLECEPVSWRLVLCRRETEFQGQKQTPQKPELPRAETEM
jgi:hypothetical protein